MNCLNGPRGILCAWILTVGLLAFSEAKLRGDGGEWLDGGKIPHLQIQISPKSMAILRGYQWKWGGNEAARTNVLVTIREGDLVYTNVALHLKGSAGSFRPIDDRPALTLNFDKEAKGQKFHGLEKIHLNNSVQDATFICEPLARDLFNAAGVPTPRASHAVVEINGRPLGLYVLVEGWNKQFLKRHFSNAKGNLFDGGFGRDIDKELLVNSGEAPDDQSSLERLYEACRDPDKAHRLANLSKVLDLDRFLSFTTMEMLIVHVDGYTIGHNNYRVFHDLSTDRMVFLPHGMDQLFGTFRSTPEYSILPKAKMAIVSKAVVESRGGRGRYLERLSQLYTNWIAGDQLLLRVDAIAKNIRPEMKADADGYRRWTQAVRGLKSRIERRVASVADQLSNPPSPLQFNGTNALLVTEWQFRPDSTGQGKGTKEPVSGKNAYVIRSGPTRPTTWPSWRTSLLLGDGVYEIQAVARLAEEPDPTAGTERAEIALRLSGDRNGYPKTFKAEWGRLNHRFEIDGTTEAELILEVRGTSSTAAIDEDSIRLRRIGPLPSTSAAP